MALREQQVELTRRAIIDSFRDLSQAPAARPVTIAEVARYSGISQATIYRHFTSRDALVMAVARDQIGLDDAEVEGMAYLPSLRHHMTGLWRELAGNLHFAHEVTVSEAGRELRRMRLAQSLPLYESPLVAAGIDPASPEGRKFVSAAALLTSAHAFLDLADRQGLSADEAVDVALWAVDVLGKSLGLDLETFAVPPIPRPQEALQS